MKFDTEILIKVAEWGLEQADKVVDVWLERRKRPSPEREPTPAPAHLTITEGRERGRRVPLTLRTTLGRGRGNSIVLRDAKVSRRHAEIRLQDGNFVIQDLNSRNGTFVNDQRISTAVALQPGDEIRVGDTVLRFEG